MAVLKIEIEFENHLSEEDAYKLTIKIENILMASRRLTLPEIDKELPGFNLLERPMFVSQVRFPNMGAGVGAERESGFKLIG